MKFLAALFLAIPFSLNAQQTPTPGLFMDGIDGYEIKLNGRIAFHTDENYFAYYETEGGYGYTKFIAFVDSGREDRVKIQEQCVQPLLFNFQQACRIKGRCAVEATGSQVRISITEVTSLEK